MNNGKTERKKDMTKRMLLSGICAVMTLAGMPTAPAADNLVGIGTFDRDEAEIMREIRDGKGIEEYDCTFDLFTEDETWNKCLRLTAGPVRKHKVSGNGISGAGVIISGDGGKGIPVEPDQFYDCSFELKGVPRRAMLDIIEYRTEDGKTVSRVLERGLRFAPGKDWRSFKKRFRTGMTAERIELYFYIWTYVDKPGSFGNDLFRPGDSLLIDNLSLVRDEQFPKIKAMLEKSGEPFRVAPYAVESDASCPFLPIELAAPPKKIVVRAAVNEKKPLPVAIANLTDSFAQYRVTLEVPSAKRNAKRPFYDSGVFGLSGYPQEKINVREALRVKDTESKPISSRLDPLVDVNGASVISVPAKETGAVWFDFDTYDVKPGVYRGNLHVIPLLESVKYRQRGGAYSDMKPAEKVIPVEFTVDPIVLPREAVRPAHMCSPCSSEEGFRLESDIGARIFNIGTRLFTPDALGNAESKVRRHIADYQRWARLRGTDIIFFVKYEALKVSQQIFNPKKNPDQKWTAWEEYVKTVAKVMEEAGVDFKSYYVLVKDEPANIDLPELREAHERLKRLYPEMRTYVSACHRTEGEIDYIDYLGRTTDMWAMSDGELARPGVFDKLSRVKSEYGAKLLHYTCSVSMREPLSAYYRRHCWRGEFMRFDADMMFRFTRSINPDYGDLSGKVIAYGEISFSTGGRVMPTVRYMAYREGMTDIKYLQALREQRGKEPEIAAFIEKAAERVVRTEANSVSAPGEVREEIRRLLLEAK